MLVEPMLSRLAAARDLNELLEVGVRDFVALHGAEMGDLQLVAPDGALVIVAARGVSREFLEVFERVSVSCGSVCGQAARAGKPIFIPDVAHDPEFEPYKAFAASVPFRSVLSCPLQVGNGVLIGMISALSSHRFHPTPLELNEAQAYCAKLAAAMVDMMPASQLQVWCEEKAAALVRATTRRRRVAAAAD